MIKAIIFDCFGVLTTEGLEVFYAKYFKDSPEKLKQAKDIIGKLNLGLISYDEFITQEARLAEVGHDIVKDYIGDNKANLPLLEYIRDNLKSKYKIGMLSNAGENWLERLFKKTDIELFDDVVLSCEIGFSKPDPKAYLIAAQRLNIQPQEAVFIDDIARYTAAAEDVGMKALLYENLPKMVEQLEVVLAA